MISFLNPICYSLWYLYLYYLLIGYFAVFYFVTILFLTFCTYNVTYLLSYFITSVFVIALLIILITDSLKKKEFLLVTEHSDLVTVYFFTLAVIINLNLTIADLEPSPLSI